MAQPVTDLNPPALTTAKLWQLVCDPAPGRLAYAMRMAAGCTVTVLVGEIWQIPDLAVPALVTMALWQKDRMSNVLVAVAVNILVLPLLAMIFGGICLTLETPVAFVSLIALLSMGFFFLSSASKLKPVAYMLGLIVVFGLVVVEQVPIGELITRALLYTDLFVSVPGAVMIVLGLLICPSPKRVLTDDIAACLRVSAVLLRGPSARDHAHATFMLREGLSDAGKLVRLAGMEKIWDPHDLACLKQAANSAVAVLALAEAEITRAGPPAPCPTELIDALESMANVFATGAYPKHVDQPATPPDQPAFQAIARVLANFTQLGAPTAEQPAKPKKKDGFFAADAFTNPEHVRFALKGTAAVMVSYVFFLFINWPGIHTCVITCFIIALPTMGEMIAKLRLRIVGALIGGSIGILSIIFLLPHLEGITGFLGFVFVVSLFAAWIRVADERIAYAGFQIGLAFYLSDLKGYGPTSDMATARDRVVGILVGIFITYGIFSSFWPSSAYGAVATRLKTVLESLGRLRAATTPQEQVACMASLQEAVSKGEQQVEYAKAESQNMRDRMAQLELFEGAFVDAGRLGTEILDGTQPALVKRIATLEALAS